MEHIRISLNEKELEALDSRLQRVVPNDYDPDTYAVLRNLYGRLVSFRMNLLYRIHLRGQHTQPTVQGSDHRITARQLEILRLLRQGKLNKEIALELDIAEQTVRNHETAMYAKLGVVNRIQAVIKGIDLGLVKPGLLPK